MKTIITRRTGFSLISVLMLTIMSFALVGGIAYIFNATSATSRAAAGRAEAYNILQDGVERGKAFLIEKMSDADRPLRWNTAPSDQQIDELADLLVRDDAGDVIGDLLGTPGQPLSVGGSSYAFSVRIYDMQFTDADIAPGLGADALAALRMTLPQAMSFSTASAQDDGNVLDPNTTLSASTNAGIYLIRASLTPDDAAAETFTIETAVIQALDNR